MKITKDTIIFITGGASGLGESAVLWFLKLGAKVAIADINETRMAQIKAEYKDRVLTFKCDVTKEEDVKYAVETTVKEWGAVHVALTSAGVNIPFLTISSKHAMNIPLFEKTMNINFWGSVYVAKYAAVAMAKNTPDAKGERGLICFVSSIASEDGERGQIAYGSSKAAVKGLVLPMARDLGKYGIRAVAVAPGVFKTPMGDKMPNKKVLQKLMSDTPMGRPGDPDEFSHFIQSIIENSYINGV